MNNWLIVKKCVFTSAVRRCKKSNYIKKISDAMHCHPFLSSSCNVNDFSQFLELMFRTFCILRSAIQIFCQKIYTENIEKKKEGAVQQFVNA